MRVLGATVLATGRRLLPSLLGAAACALAWLVLGAGPAHGNALLPDPDPGLLGEVVEVAAPVEPVRDTTTEVVAQVVDQVTAPAPPAVADPVRRAADAVLGDVDRVASPVVAKVREVAAPVAEKAREVATPTRQVPQPAPGADRTPVREARPGAGAARHAEGRGTLRTAPLRTDSTADLPAPVRVAMNRIPSPQGDFDVRPLLPAVSPTDGVEQGAGGSPAPDGPRDRPTCVAASAVPASGAAQGASALAVLSARQGLPVAEDVRALPGGSVRPDSRTTAPGSRPD